MLRLSKPLLLGSSSPRRQQLMRDAGFDFTVASPDCEETFPDTLSPESVPSFLALKKADALASKHADKIILTADTVVLLDNHVLNKPQDYAEAMQMLTALSGRTHTVITAVCLARVEEKNCFEDKTTVTFRTLQKEEIDFYINTCKPFDKAGAYGAQDWIGLTAIEKIVGSYFTVMGLPLHLVYAQLKKWSTT